MTADAMPAKNCPLCLRLVKYRKKNKENHPDWFNGAVPCFGDAQARLLIVGLAPGSKGANRTGRPFTGDSAGTLLYDMLAKFGFSTGQYGRHSDDGLQLHDCLITNAVRCVPPDNKPNASEINQCRPFLAARIEQQTKMRIILALGHIAHKSILKVFDIKLKDAPFAHGTRHQIGSIALYNSYHCSRININTRRLTPEMFECVFTDIAAELES